MRVTGKRRRRFLRNGTRIARSPICQYSITRMEAGRPRESPGGNGAGRIGTNRCKSFSKARTKDHLRGVIRKKLARAEAAATGFPPECGLSLMRDMLPNHPQ